MSAAQLRQISGGATTTAMATATATATANATAAPAATSTNINSCSVLASVSQIRCTKIASTWSATRRLNAFGCSASQNLKDGYSFAVWRSC